MIVSLSHFVYDELTPAGNPNNNPLCGTKLRAKRVNELTGQMTSVDLTVVDRCKFCEGVVCVGLVLMDLFDKVLDASLRILMLVRLRLMRWRIMTRGG
jgi:hypothetical protein